MQEFFSQLYIYKCSKIVTEWLFGLKTMFSTNGGTGVPVILTL